MLHHRHVAVTPTQSMAGEMRSGLAFVRRDP